MWHVHVIRSLDPTRLTTPFWPRPLERYPGRLPDRADVLLVERNHLASGASGRNAGFLLAGVADCYAESVRIFGRTRARDIWHMTMENHVEEIEAVKGQEIGHR